MIADRSWLDALRPAEDEVPKRAASSSTLLAELAEGDRATRAAVVRDMSVEVIIQGVQRTYANVAGDLSSPAEEKLTGCF